MSRTEINDVIAGGATIRRCIVEEVVGACAAGQQITASAPHDEVVSAFTTSTDYRHWEAYAGRDPAPVAQAVARFQLGQMSRLDRLERALNRLLDQDVLLPLATVSVIRDYAQAHEFRLVEAQTERALGRLQKSVDSLQRARTLFERAGAAPYSARVRCEQALLTGDHAEMEAGLQVLERLGDAEQLGRFERLQVG